MSLWLAARSNNCVASRSVVGYPGGRQTRPSVSAHACGRARFSRERGACPHLALDAEPFTSSATPGGRQTRPSVSAHTSGRVLPSRGAGGLSPHLTFGAGPKEAPATPGLRQSRRGSPQPLPAGATPPVTASRRLRRTTRRPREWPRGHLAPT